MVEELCMMPVFQVFIMVLIQGVTRSNFHHQMDLFLFTFATKVPQEVVFTKAHFQFFSFYFNFIFLEFLERAQAF